MLDVVDSVAVEPSRPPSVLVEAKSASKKESPSGQEITSSTARFRRNPAVLDALIHYKRTVAIVETLVAHNTIDQDYLAKSFAARYAQGPARGYSAATHRSLSAIKLGVPWRWTANSLFGGAGSCGNGAAMRASVVGAWFAPDLDRVVHEARLSAEVTHTHPEGVAGAIAVAVAAALACGAEQCPMGHDFIQAVLDEVPEGEVRQRAARGLLIGFGTPIGRAAEALGNGSALRAQDTVPLVLWCTAQHLGDYESALWLTVAALGDRDTTCAMVGGIVACYTGTAGLPVGWLAHREPLPAV